MTLFRGNPQSEPPPQKPGVKGFLQLRFASTVEWAPKSLGLVIPESLKADSQPKTRHLTDKSSKWDPSGRGGRGEGSHDNGNGSHGNGSGSNIPSLLSMATRSHMDITTPPLPQVSAEVLRVAEHRHRRGLMYPEIYHILTKVPQTQRIDIPRDIPHTDQGTTDTED
ncbi:unnamed protein product [Coregonus sp. 'balchen']|nr:unnamed protein product [Coregonus sp. 'balchen']